MVRDDGNDGRHDREQGEFPPARETERPLVRELDEIVEEPDRPARERREQHGQRLQPVVADRQEADRRREEDEDATHRRRPLLDDVVLRPLLADVLPELVAAEEFDEAGPDRDRQDERDAGGDEDADHDSGSTRASATASSPTEREPFTRIASPGRTTRATSSTASAAVATHSSGE